MLGNVWQRHFTWLTLAVILAGLAAGAALAALTQAPAAQTAQPSTGLPAVGAPTGSGPGQIATGAGSQASAAAGVFGEVASVTAEAVTVRGQQGEAKASLAGAKITRTADGAAEDLKAGQRISAVAQQESDGSYTATSIQIGLGDQPPRGMMIQGQGAGGGAVIRGQAQQGGAQGQPNADQRTRPLSGSISSVDAGVLTVSTDQGEAKIKVAGARIQKTVEATAQELQAGQRVMVTGQRSADGGFTSAEIQILPTGDQQPAAGGAAGNRQRQ